MQLEFKLEEQDLVTLAKYQMENSPKFVRRYRMQRFGVLAVFLLLALGALIALGRPALALYTAALGAFLFGFYPFYYRWLIGRTLRRIVGARLNPTVFGPRVLRLTSEGLEQTAMGKKVVVPWSRVGVVMVTPKHAFISIDGIFAQAIPRARVEDELFVRFVQALRAGRPEAMPAGS